MYNLEIKSNFGMKAKVVLDRSVVEQLPIANFFQ